jgi:hypothetical protein
MRRIAAALFCSVCVAGLAAGPAGARSVVTKPPSYGPVLAGARVMWATERRDGGFDLRSQQGDQNAQVVRAFPPSPGSSWALPQFAASSTRIVLARHNGGGDDCCGRDVFTAPLGGEFEVLDAGCPEYNGPDKPRDVDVSGDAVVFPLCDKNGAKSIVRDYSGAPPVDWEVPGRPAGGLRIAGRYVAAFENFASNAFNPGPIDVYDRVTGQLVYQLPKKADRGISNYDLQADGKIALSYVAPGSGGGRVGWASPSEPFLHRLPLPARPFYDVRMAGNRIAYEAGRSAPEIYFTLADIGVTDLAGHRRRLGNQGEGEVFDEFFDFDGKRVAWWSYGCTRAKIRVVRADGPPAISPPRHGCKLRFRRPPRVAGRSVHLFLDCFGFPAEACHGRHVVLSTDRRGHRVVGRGRYASKVRLTRRGRQLLTRRGSLRVFVRALVTDESGQRERRRGRTTLAAIDARGGAREHQPAGSSSSSALIRLDRFSAAAPLR